MKKILKKLVILIHKLVLLYSIVGFLLPKKYLFYFILFWPTIYLHWQINNDCCMLTELECYLADKPFILSVGENRSLKRWFAKYTINTSTISIRNYITCFFTITWLIGVIRYLT